MVPLTSPWTQSFVRMGWNGGVSVREARNKLIPVLFVGCFLNPTFERAKRVNCDLWDIHKQKLEVLHNKIFVVEERSSSPSNLVATRCQHLLGWAVMRSLHYLSNEVELSGGNHITYSRYVIEHLSECSFLICSSFIFVTDTHRIHRMLRWRKTSSLLDMAFLINHVSHAHNSRFIGTTQKSKYLLHISR